MPKITLSNFGGMVPLKHQRLLKDNQAQIATNVDLSGGSLSALGQPTSQSVATLGSDISEYGTYDSGVGGWVGYVNNTVENDSGAVKCTYVDSIGMYLYLSNAVSLTENLVVGAWYQYTIKVKVNAGSSVILNYYSAEGAVDYTVQTITSTDYTSVTFYKRATHATGDALCIYGMGAGEICWVDDFTVKKAPGYNKTLWKCGDTFIFPGTFDADCTVIDSPVQEDYNRFLFTGDSNPKQANSSTWATRTAYRLGVTPPAVAPTITVQGSADADVQDYVSYVFTMVTAWGEESAPSTATAVTTIMNGQYVDLSVMTTPTDAQHNFQYKRIYRLSSGKAGGQFCYLGQIAYAETTYSDKGSGDTLKAVSTDVLETTGWAIPPAGLTGLCLAQNNMLAGFYGKEVYISEPGAPYAWPTANKITLDSAVTGIGATDEYILAISTRHPYIITGNSPEGLVPTKLDLVMKCSSNRGVVPTDKGIFFPTKDGLAFCNGQTVINVTENTITTEQWQAINTGTFVAKMYGSLYLAITEGGGTGIMVDPDTGEYTTFDLSTYLDAIYDIYSDATTGDLYLLGTLATVPKVYTFDSSASLTTYVWTSKRFMTPHRFNCAKVKGYWPEGATLTFGWYLDGVVKKSKSVTSERVFRLPSDCGSNDKEIRLTGTVQIEMVEVATSPDELT